MKRSAGFKQRLAFALIGLALAVWGCDGDDRSTKPQVSPSKISGTITASLRFVTDSDVNDPSATYNSNDSFDDAQSIPNPVVVGGYVNTPLSGSQGRSFTSGDGVDYFRMDLSAGQVVALYVSGYPDAELDLALFDDNQQLVDEVFGPADVLALSAPTDGTYYVEVRVFKDASLYTLAVGQPAPSAAKYAPRLSDDFMPGEIIVRLQTRQRKDGAAMAFEPSGMKVLSGDSESVLLLDIGDDTEVRQWARMRGISNAERRDRVQNPLQERKRQTLKAVSEMRKHPDVKTADLNYIRRPCQVVNDPQYSLQWHYALMNLPQAWGVTTGSPAVVVAVIDTGVLSSHPDLQGRLTAGYDFISKPSMAGDGDGIDPDPEDPGDQAAGGSSFHGTHVIGTVAALTNNALGVAGVTHATQVMPLRVLGIGGGTEFDVLQAVRFAAGLRNNSRIVPAPRADVINLSLGGSGFSQTAQEVLSEARAQGVIIIAAAGNDASTVPFYPAAYDGVVAVSAIDINGNLAFYSNSGPTVDLAAPGGDKNEDRNGDGYPDGVISTCGDDTRGSIRFTYCFAQGTSMASPHVAGVAALMKAVYPALTPDEFDVMLVNGQLTNSLSRDNQLGYGTIDAFLAVAAARDLAGGSPLPPTIIAEPPFVDLSAINLVPESMEFEIRNGGQGQLVLESVGTDPAATWLRVAEKAVDTDKLGVYTVTGDPTGFGPGVYSSQITVTPVDSAVKPLNVPVTLQVVSLSGDGNVGFLYVLLVDPETGKTLIESNVPFDARTGNYRYVFRNVTPAIYNIIAGTDADNNLIIGEFGEAIGAYRTLDLPMVVVSPGQNQNLDFSVGFRVALPSEVSTQMFDRIPLRTPSVPKRAWK